jgi:hypothetical protein
MTVRLKVEEIRESSASLAVKLAEALNNVSLFIDEAEKYLDHARTEETKLRDLEDVYARVLERDRLLAEGKPLPPPKKRMDPVLTFDAASLADQLLKTNNRVAAYRAQAEISRSKADAEKTRSKLLQVEVKKAVEREKNKAK